MLLPLLKQLPQQVQQFQGLLWLLDENGVHGEDDDDDDDGDVD